MSKLEIQVSGTLSEVIEVESVYMACDVIFCYEKVEPNPKVLYCLNKVGEFHGYGKSYFYWPEIH